MEPEPEPELDEALLLSMVRRAVVLEETGRPEEALPLYEQAYAAFKAAGQQRGKLVRRIINCRCRLSGEEQGVVVQGDATALDADASLDALRARRIGERAHEQQHAATRIQSRFRGRKQRVEYVQQQSQRAEGALHVDDNSAFGRALRRGRQRHESEMQLLQGAAESHLRRTESEAARAAHAEAEVERLTAQMEFLRETQPETFERLEDDAGRAEMSGRLAAELSVLQPVEAEKKTGGRRRGRGRKKKGKEAKGKAAQAWTQLCSTLITHKFNTLTLQLTGRNAGCTELRLLVRRPTPGAAVHMAPPLGPIPGTEWCRQLDANSEPFFYVEKKAGESAGLFTAAFEYPQEGTAAQDDDLPLSVDDVVVVAPDGCTDPNWWQGHLRDAPDSSGYFPANFVIPYGARRDEPAEVKAALQALVSRDPLVVVSLGCG